MKYRVFIQKETGGGRELVERDFHYQAIAATWADMWKKAAWLVVAYNTRHAGTKANLTTGIRQSVKASDTHHLMLLKIGQADGHSILVRQYLY